MNRYSSKILIRYFIQSFFTVWALMKACRLEPGNILSGILFILCLCFYRQVDKRLKDIDSQGNNAIPQDLKSARRVSALTAVIFSTLYLAVGYPNYIESLTNPLFRLGIILCTALGFLFLFYYLLLFLYSFMAKNGTTESLLFNRENDNTNLQESNSAKGLLLQRSLFLYRNHTGICCFLLCMICWLPYFLYQYPGIMTPDSINQFEQVLEVIPYSNHHPWVHTLLIKLFYSIGYFITGDMVTALSFYTFFQMCILALAAGYCTATLRRCGLRPKAALFVILFYALIPYHGVYSVTIWKDILFAAALLLLGCALLRLLICSGRGDYAVIAISGLMLCLFRSNGWYGFLICFPFLLVGLGRKFKPLIPILLGILFTAIIIKYPVMSRFHVTQPDLVESLSIPVQQVASVLCHDRPVSQEQLDQINQVVDLTYIHELYNPYYADNIKELIRAGNQEYLAQHKGEYLKLWLQLGLAYPGDYLTAYIRQTYGYWYPDSFYLVAEAEGVSATTLGVSHTPLIGGPLVIKAKEIAIKLGSMIPIYGMLWSMGVICWVLILCAGCVLIRKERSKLLVYLPSVAVLFTVLIATPVATEFRYVYFMILSLPLYLGTVFVSKK